MMLDHRIIQVRPMQKKNSLCAFVTIELLGRVTILDAPLFQNDDGFRLGMPGSKVNGRFFPHVSLQPGDLKDIEDSAGAAYQELEARQHAD